MFTDTTTNGTSKLLNMFQRNLLVTTWVSDFLNCMDMNERKIEKQDTVIHVMTDSHRKCVRPPIERHRRGEKEDTLESK
jgi:hypothetical protein